MNGKLIQELQMKREDLNCLNLILSDNIFLIPKKSKHTWISEFLDTICFHHDFVLILRFSKQEKEEKNVRL